ncbi:MAG: DNA repair protein RecO [Alphaproteobacteria bacterium]|nr:DNA repair protein RecO [Alphaproteobacteria bacterium]
MRFSDEGIIISTKKYGEDSLVVKIFSREHGIYRGFVRQGKSRKVSAIYQVGNFVSFEFRSRLEENLGGFFSVNLLNSFCAKILFDHIRLNCFASLFSMLDELFLERETHQVFFVELLDFLQKNSAEEFNPNPSLESPRSRYLNQDSADLALRFRSSAYGRYAVGAVLDPSQQNPGLARDRGNSNDGLGFKKKFVVADYIKLELAMLRELGYGIDLSSCVVTSATTDLAFVSPKSAQAVCFTAGKPYQHKLLKLPKFLLEMEGELENEHLLNGLKLSGFFLQKFLPRDPKKYSHRDEISRVLSS